MHKRVCLSVKKGNILVRFTSENIHRELLSLISLIQLFIIDSLWTRELPACWLGSSLKADFHITGLVCTFFLLFLATERLFQALALLNSHHENMTLSIFGNYMWWTYLSKGNELSLLLR